jgi:hypothetical protein
MADEDLDAKQREIVALLSGLCAAPERDELRIAALRALLADVQEQIQARDLGRD